MKETFDPNDPKALEAALADLAQDEVALSPDFRSRLLSDAARVTRPRPVGGMAWFRDWIGFAGLPAAAVMGAWLGIVNPSLVLEVTPWQSGDTSGAVDVDTGTEDNTLIVEVFGGAWVPLEDEE